MLEKERFLTIKNKACSIRKENERLFESLKRVPLEDAIREKEEFIEAAIEHFGIKFSPGEIGREEQQIFRANILIPGDVDFFQTYSKDKNIRNLMNHYSVNIEDIMSKITELNIYGKYIEEKEEGDFEEEMIKENDVTNDAIDLLNEIKSLTDDIDDTLEQIEKEEVKETFTTPLDNVNLGVINLLEPEEMPSLDIEKSDLEVRTAPKFINSNEENLENMDEIVSSFVDSFNELKIENANLKSEIEDLKYKLNSLNEKMTNRDDEMISVNSENAELKAKNASLEAKIKESKVLINKIYSCIAPKQ